ncbi:TetR/AcrR family transcriptional regulator [Nocardia grenadensis]|uniref:TetR/AcrR family transcriptional regulator n=1 Tax=Nocardia grenadensis TaxID=931537 RepID=UPI000A03756B|nr:TetR family transcriptional regulator [Nocardia grenadensis]
MATLREAQKEMTRESLLEAGLELFVSKGYATAKVDLIKAHITERPRPALDRVPTTTHGSTERELVAVVEDGSRERIRAWLDASAQRSDTVRPYNTTAFEAAAVDPELRGLFDEWMNEAIGDIEDGLERAGRFAAGTRRFRGVLASTELDHVARNWTAGQWGTGYEKMLDVRTDSWFGFLGRG